MSRAKRGRSRETGFEYDNMLIVSNLEHREGCSGSSMYDDGCDEAHILLHGFTHQGQRSFEKQPPIRKPSSGLTTTTMTSPTTSGQVHAGDESMSENITQPTQILPNLTPPGNVLAVDARECIDTINDHFNLQLQFVFKNLFDE